MALEDVRKVFEEWGDRDPMHAVLTRKGYEASWDPDDFFRRGREEVAAVFEHLAEAGLDDGPADPPAPARGRALDFGCGVGRLTQALATRFEAVVGVDISSSMIEAARSHDRTDGRATYRVNTRPDLSLFETATFDFVYSSKTLQHLPPRFQEVYIREFVRVLRPGGLAVFQTRNGPRIRPGTLRSWLYTLRREHLRRAWRRTLGKPAYEMHFVARSRIVEVVEESGGVVVDVVDLSSGRPGRSLRYHVRRR